MSDVDFLILLAFAGFLAIAFYLEVWEPEHSARGKQERADRDAQRAVEADASMAEYWAKRAAQEMAQEMWAIEHTEEAEEAEWERLRAVKAQVKAQRERERLYNEKYPQE